jgi:predicted nucleotidyltransferase
MALEIVKPALVETLASESRVVAAYLFGSVARGTVGPLSDIDVGLLVSDPSESEAVCSRTMDALCRRLQTSRLDVVSLTDAPVPLVYRVVRDGLLVACRDATVVERFVADTVLHYLDFKPLRDRALALMRDAILQHT